MPPIDDLKTRLHCRNKRIPLSGAAELGEKIQQLLKFRPGFTDLTPNRCRQRRPLRNGLLRSHYQIAVIIRLRFQRRDRFRGDAVKRCIYRISTLNHFIRVGVEQIRMFQQILVSHLSPRTRGPVMSGRQRAVSLIRCIHDQSTSHLVRFSFQLRLLPRFVNCVPRGGGTLLRRGCDQIIIQGPRFADFRFKNGRRLPLPERKVFRLIQCFQNRPVRCNVISRVVVHLSFSVVGFSNPGSRRLQKIVPTHSLCRKKRFTKSAALTIITSTP